MPHSRPDPLAFPTDNPRRAWRAVWVLFLLCVAFRVADVLFLRSDEWLGEQVLTKFVGLIAILIYLAVDRKSLAAIGWRRAGAFGAIVIGAAIAGLSLLAGYGAELFVLAHLEVGPSLRLGVQDHALLPDTAARGGLGFGLGLMAGNFLNSTMEESLFRGLMISHFLLRMSFLRANLLQAALFGLWHVVWPLRAWMDGDMSAPVASLAAPTYIIASGLAGLAWGMLYRTLHSLWGAFAAHTVHNSTLNVLHVDTMDGESSLLAVRVGVAVLVLVILGIAAARRRRAPLTQAP